MVTWDAIECTQRNGIITGYVVEFQEQGGARIPGEVGGQNFTASGLTPATHYTFRVSGVNRNGTGPFTATTIISTDEDSKLCRHSIMFSCLLHWFFLIIITLENKNSLIYSSLPLCGFRDTMTAVY